MNERKKKITNLIVKLIVLISLHVGCTFALAGWLVYVEYSWYIDFRRFGYILQNIFIIAVFQILVYINFKIKKLTEKKYKITYIVLNLFLLLVTFLIWVVGFIVLWNLE